MGKYFGTDGFRGEANLTLTAKQAFDIGRYLGYYYGKNNGGTGKIVVGKDTRRSSYMFESAIAAGITASGTDAYLLHVTTTPSVSYVTRTEQFDCGVMITASHNGFTDNGIKIISSSGDKIDDELIDLIEKYIDGEIPEVPFATGSDIGRVVDHAAGRNRYIGYLIALSAYSFKDKRIGLDCANGSAWMIAGSVFNALGAKTYIIGNEPDGENINRECGSTCIDRLCELVREKKLDAGFAFDGDADRCIAVNENGEVVNGDAIMYILGKYLKEHGQLPTNTIVTTSMSNTGLYRALERIGIDYEITDVGDRFVRARMLEGGHMLGGENSGHVIIGKYASTGDGILTAIMVMGVSVARKMPLSELHKDVHFLPQLLVNFEVTDPAAAACDPAIRQTVDSLSKGICANGRIILRKSGTQPLVRLMIEAESDELCKSAAETVRRALYDGEYLN